MSSTMNQRFLVCGEERFVSIIRNQPSGERFALIRGGSQSVQVPVDMLGLAAGKDAWMREIRFRCSGCREPFRASEMESQLCPRCLEETEAYNALLDRGGPPPEENEPQ